MTGRWKVRKLPPRRGFFGIAPEVWEASPHGDDPCPDGWFACRCRTRPTHAEAIAYATAQARLDVGEVPG